MLFFILLLIAILNETNAQRIIPILGDTTVTECAIKIMQHHYHERSFISYAANEELVKDLLKSASKYTLLNLEKSLKIVKTFKYKHYFYVVIVSVIDDYENFIEASYRTRGWNPRAKILVVYLGNSNINKIFQLSWKYFGVNVSVLTTNLTVYTYFPLTENNCGETITKTLIYNCDGDISNSSIFPNKLGLSFHGCPVKILPLVIEPYILHLYRKDNPGYEMVMLREICRHLNLTIQYVDHSYKHWGTKLSDGTYTDMYNLMLQNKAELMIGMVLANESYAEDLEDTYPHSEVDLTFHVPTPLTVEGWKNFIIIFSVELWLGFGISMLSCMFTWWIIGCNQEASEGFDNLSYCAFKVWCVVFSCFSMQPKTALIRLIYILWTIYSFLMISTYTSVLIGFLTRPSYEKDIATTIDMVNSDLKYGGLYIIRYVFDEPGNPTYLTLYKRFLNCALAMQCTNRTAFKRDFGVIKNARQVAYFVPLLYTYPNGRPMIKRVKDTVVPQNLWMNTVKGFLYMERFNDVILRLREGGFIFKWDYEATNTWKKSLEEPPSVIPLNLTHLKFGFFCLLIGSFVAFVILLFEIRAFIRVKTYFCSTVLNR